MKRFVAIAILFLAGVRGISAGDGEPLNDFALGDTRGRVHTAAAWKDKKAVVLVFLGTECPVSNGYAPEYRRLVETYTSKGVLFYGVHPDPEVTAASARKHAAEYRQTWTLLLDPTQKAAKQLGIKVVPEAVVLSPRGQVLYRGRIDDLYTPDGRRRVQPTTRDLEEAVKATLAGKPPPIARTAAFGCPLPEPIKRP